MSTVTDQLETRIAKLERSRKIVNVKLAEAEKQIEAVTALAKFQQRQIDELVGKAHKHDPLETALDNVKPLTEPKPTPKPTTPKTTTPWRVPNVNMKPWSLIIAALIGIILSSMWDGLFHGTPAPVVLIGHASDGSEIEVHQTTVDSGTIISSYINHQNDVITGSDGRQYRLDRPGNWQLVGVPQVSAPYHRRHEPGSKEVVTDTTTTKQ